MTPRDYVTLGRSQIAVSQYVVVAIFYPLAVVAIIFRLWARSIKRKALEINDHSANLALIFTTALAVDILMGAGWAGTGDHIVDIEPKYRTRVYIMFAFGQPVWASANTAVKFSILHLYMVIFPSKNLHRVCYFTMAISMGYWIHVLLETFLLCTPVQFNWDKSIDGTCDPNALSAYVIAGSINLAIDLLIVVIPIPLLWRLQMSLRRKIGIMSMFSLGAVICIISLLRVVFIAKIDLNDFNYFAGGLGVYSFLEPSLGIVNASMPVLKPIGNMISKSRTYEWAKSSFQISRSMGGTAQSRRNTSAWSNSRSKRSQADNFQRLEDPTDRMYQLDTINLVGAEDRRQSSASRLESAEVPGPVSL